MKSLRVTCWLLAWLWCWLVLTTFDMLPRQFVGYGRYDIPIICSATLSSLLCLIIPWDWLYGIISIWFSSLVGSAWIEVTGLRVWVWPGKAFTHSWMTEDTLESDIWTGVRGGVEQLVGTCHMSDQMSNQIFHNHKETVGNMKLIIKKIDWKFHPRFISSSDLQEDEKLLLLH